MLTTLGVRGRRESSSEGESRPAGAQVEQLISVPPDVRLTQAVFAGLMVAGLLLSAAAFAHLTYTSIWLQSVLGMSPIKAGLAVSPLALTSFVVAGFGGRLLGKLAPQWPIGIGLALIGAGTLTLVAEVGGGSTSSALIPGLLIAGVGVGTTVPVLTSAAMSAVPHDRAGMAGGALNTFRQLGYALGIAVLGTFFAKQAVAGTGVAARGAVATSLDHVFAVAGATALVAAAAVLLLVRRPAAKA